MSRLRVSDHAVLRYLERVGGFEIEKLRSEIASRIGEAWSGEQLYVPVDGFSFVVRHDAKGPIITTVLRLPPPKPKRPPRFRKIDDA